MMLRLTFLLLLVAPALSRDTSASLRAQVASLPHEAMLATRAPAARAGSDSGALLTPALADFVQSTLSTLAIKGIAVAVVRRAANGTFSVNARGFGVRNGAGEPMTAQTRLPIASNSKQFTAAALGLLALNGTGDFGFDTPWSSVLPEFQLQDDFATRQADVVDILSHRTGLPRHDLILTRDGLDADFSLRVVKGLRPSEPFRRLWQYNNHMFNIAASLVSRLAAAPFPDFMKARIFDAAGMSATTYDQSVFRAGEHSEGFWRQGENSTSAGQLLATLVPAHRPGMNGAGGIMSTADDMAVWLQVMLNNGVSPVTGQVVVPAIVLQAMSTGITVETGSGISPEMAPIVYGLGLQHSAYQGHEWVGHDGSLTGYMAQTTWFPNDGLGIAVLTNDLPRGAWAHNAITWRIAEALLNMPLQVDWLSRYETANQAALEAAASQPAPQPSPPGAAAPSAPFSALAGCYTDFAYGNLTLALDKTNTTLSALAPQFGAGSVFTLSHYDADVFNASISLFQPGVDGAQLNLDVVLPLLADFGVSGGGRVQGFGLSGGAWLAEAGVPDPVGATAEERAEVWFAKTAALS